jgi:transposase
MPAERVSMRQIREVLRLRFASELPQRAIAKSLGLSQGAVSGYLSRARAAGVSWPLPAELDDVQLEALLFPPLPAIAADQRALPDWAWVHRELRRPNVTLALLWEEYRAGTPDGFGYSWFCDLYRGWAGRLKPTMRQTHIAGEKLFVDFAGRTGEVVDGLTGEIIPVQIFVAVLGASNFTYAEAVWSQKLPDWIAAHVRAFAYFGGVARQTVYDYVPRNIIVVLCRPRLCGEPPRIAVTVTATGHISIRGQRAIRAALVRSAKLVFGEVPPKRSKEAGTPPMLPASS